MNGIVFVFGLLFLQVSGSYFDKLYSAVSTVENGLEKLISNIVTDVKDTVDSTISAVYDVLGSNALNTVSTSNDELKIVSKPINYGEYSTSNTLPGAGSAYESIDKTINDAVSNYNGVDNAAEAFEKQTNRLYEISEILRRELEYLSNNYKIEIKTFNFNENQVSVETIWEQIKNLNELEKKSTDTVERKEVRQVLDKVLSGLHLKSQGNETLGTQELDDVKKELHKLLNEESEGSHLENQSSRKDSDISTAISTISNYNNASNTLKDKINEKLGERDSSNKINNENVKHKNNTTEKELGDKSIFNVNLDGLNYITPFSNSSPVNRADIDSAKKIIEESRRTDKLLKDFFKQKHDSVDVFSNPDIFDFGKR